MTKVNTVGAAVMHPTDTSCKALESTATWHTTTCRQFTTATTTGTNAHAMIHLKSCTIHSVAAGGLYSVDIPEQENMGLADLTHEGACSDRYVKSATSAKHTSEREYQGVGGFCSGKGTGDTLAGITT